MTFQDNRAFLALINHVSQVLRWREDAPPPMVESRPRAGVVERCAYCHAEDGKLEVCPGGCGSKLHEECRGEAKKCPTLACHTYFEVAVAHNVTDDESDLRDALRAARSAQEEMTERAHAREALQNAQAAQQAYGESVARRFEAERAPTAPVNLQAQAVSPNEVRLTWDLPEQQPTVTMTARGHDIVRSLERMERRAVWRKRLTKWLTRAAGVGVFATICATPAEPRAGYAFALLLFVFYLVRRM